MFLVALGVFGAGPAGASHNEDPECQVVDTSPAEPDEGMVNDTGEVIVCRATAGVGGVGESAGGAGGAPTDSGAVGAVPTRIDAGGGATAPASAAVPLSVGALVTLLGGAVAALRPWRR